MKNSCAVCKRLVCALLCVLIAIPPIQISANEQNTDIESISNELDNSVGQIGGYLAGNTRAIQALRAERIFYASPSGFGFAAEQGNNLIDVLSGTRATVVGGDNVLNGADRLIVTGDGTQIWIQSKYYATAAGSVAAGFDEITGLYRYLDADGMPMQLEVPADQYDDAVLKMQEKIRQGKVPNVTDVDEAASLVRKGNLTYTQARNLAKAGTFESLTYDATNGAIVAVGAMGISFAIDYAMCCMNGMSAEDALKNAGLNGLKTGGTVFATYVIASQIAKTGVKSALVPSTEAIASALGPKASQAIVATFGKSTTTLTGTQLTKAAAECLQSTLIVDGVLLVVLTAGDVYDLFQGNISKEQLIKNVVIATVGVGAGTVGTVLGSTAGTALFPGAGSWVGGIVGGVVIGGGATIAADAVANIFFEEDAEKMLAILSDEFEFLCVEYLLDEEEAAAAVAVLQEELDGDTLKEMHASEDRAQFAQDLMVPIFETQAMSREEIELPTEEMVRSELKESLQGVIFIH